MRIVNRLLSLVLGLVLVAAGLLVLAWLVATEVGRTNLPGQVGAWYDTGTALIRSVSGLTLRAEGVVALSLLLAVVGLIWFILELRPSPPQRLMLVQDGEWTWWAERRSCESLAASILADRTTAIASRVHIGRRWHIAVDAGGDAEAKREVEAQMTGTLTRLGLGDRAAVQYRMHRTQKVS